MTLTIVPHYEIMRKGMLTVFGAMAEIEREYIVGRQAEGAVIYIVKSKTHI